MSDKWAPPGIDVTTPNVARMYDYWLGGKDNFAVDREAAEKIMAISSDPGVVRDVRANRGFLGRAVRTAAELGIDQFLDVGSGLPTRDNAHDAARRADPTARVAYVDYDPVVCTHGRAILASTPGIAFVQGDARRPAEIIENPEVRALIDFNRPMALLLVAVLHLIPDHDKPAEIVARFRDAMAPGSMLILSHISKEPRPAEVAKAADIYEDASAGLVPRTRPEILSFFDGFELLEPGLVNTPAWRPDISIPDAAKYPVLAGVGRLEAR